jgi:hypothetical protein
MAKKAELTLDQHIHSLRGRKTPELLEICHKHGLTPDKASDYELVEALAGHSPACICPTERLAEMLLPFEARQVQRVGDTVAPYVSFSFDGENAVINLDKPFIMPNLETFAEVLFEIAYRDSFRNFQMLSGDEISLSQLCQLYANDPMSDAMEEIEIDNEIWMSCKPCDREGVKRYAIAMSEYVIIGGSGSPGADDDGWAAVCQFRRNMWIYYSDPGTWYDLGEITREAALTYFRDDSEYLRMHPEEYEYSEWLANLF